MASKAWLRARGNKKWHDPRKDQKTCELETQAGQPRAGNNKALQGMQGTAVHRENPVPVLQGIRKGEDRLPEAEMTVWITATMESPETCKVCSGSGACPWSHAPPCPQCRGAGFIPVDRCYAYPETLPARGGLYSRHDAQA
jgi:hypothetical protein